MWQRARLSDYIGDYVVYRNLEPLDARLQGLRRIWPRLGFDHYFIPRKTAPEYAAALADLLIQAQRARGVQAPLRQVLFIGDTAMNDGTAARLLGRYWAMRAFIGTERPQQPPHIEVDGDLMLANRWGALGEFIEWARKSGMAFDEGTAVIIDLDKTFMGARGRNDRAIDAARISALERTLQEALGSQAGKPSFLTIYDALNQPAYHAFTKDNQDYLAYVCLMVAGGIYDAETFWRDIQSGALASFEEFVARCHAKRPEMPSGLARVHDQVCQGLAAEDPTPFKTFRRAEYLETVARMDSLPDEASLSEILAREIVITAEVANLATWMAAQGALLFGSSDKPDEASIPTAELAQGGCQPLHRTPMKVYGQTIV